MKRLSALFLSLVMALSLTACGSTDDIVNAALDAAISAVEDYGTSADIGIIGGADGPTSIIVAGPSDPDEIGVIGGEEFTIYLDTPREGEYYYDLENVVLYLEYYGELPDNYITKDEARALGWKGGTPERYLEGSAIGGDRFGNREGLLPEGEYTECDLNTLGEDERGAERLVFSDDGRYYHTEDHYASFTKVWVEDGEVIW